MLFCNFTAAIRKLPGNETGADLKLIEDLTAERVCLGVAGYRSVICGKLYNGTAVVVCLVVYSPGSTIRRCNNLSNQLAFGIIVVLNDIYYGLSRYNLTGENDIALVSTGKFAFLVLIIILFVRCQVNRAHNVALTVIDILVMGG